MDRIGAVLIGRNEGQRLVRALEAVTPRVGAAVYVDSGSTDDSMAEAQQRGVDAVALDLSMPFSAARARNAGFERLMEMHPGLDYVQFIDGDCEVVEGWLETAQRFLDEHSKAAAACGRLRERFPEASFYNRLIDLEWDTPVGEVPACGGIALIRVAAFREVGGFDPSVMAGEEPEMCRRLRARGWTIHRLDAEMALHDADMHRFAQWWRRDVRTGYGSLDIATRFPDTSHGAFVAMVRRARLWSAVFPLSVLVAGLTGGLLAGWAGALIGAGLVALAAPAQVARQALRYHRRGLPWHASLRAAGINLIGKWAQALGHRRYRRDRAARKMPRLIEKIPQSSPVASSSTG